MSIISLYISIIFINIFSQTASPLYNNLISLEENIDNDMNINQAKELNNYGKDIYGNTALYYAVVMVINDNAKIIKILIDNGADLFITYDTTVEKQTILHLAVISNKFNTTKTLLEKLEKLEKLDFVNHLNGEGKTVLDCVEEMFVVNPEEKEIAKTSMYNLLRQYKARTSLELIQEKEEEEEEEYLKEIKLHPKEKEI